MTDMSYRVNRYPSYLLPEAVERLHSRCDPEPGTGCLLWRGSVTGPYQSFKVMVSGHRIPGQRAVLEHSTGVLLGYKERVKASCGNKRCLNPAHLSLR